MFYFSILSPIFSSKALPASVAAKDSIAPAKLTPPFGVSTSRAEDNPSATFPALAIILILLPLMFLAQERELAEDAFAGDIIGIPNHGQLRIGDTLTEGEKITFTGIPSFAPELLKSARALDPLKSKHLGDALKQIAEEGGASIFKPVVGAEWIVGVVGVLQFEVMADRIKNEFGLPVMFEQTQYYTARWISADDKNELNKFIDANRLNIAEDNDGALVFLARNAWHLNKAQEDFPKVKFSKIKE